MKIAAFNVKNLGWKKVNNKAVRETLIKIVSRYDVIVLLEVMDESGKAMNKLFEELNKFGRNKHHPYDMIGSEPLGRGSYKERFVFFYRKDEAKVIDTFQYEEDEDETQNGEDEYGDEEDDEEEEEDDEEEEEDDDDDEDYYYEYETQNGEDEYRDEEEDDNDDEEEEDDADDDEEDDDDEEEEDTDRLSREPFCVLFQCPKAVVKKLVLIPVHTKPKDAGRELDAVADVVEEVKRKWNTDNIMILGDFNADGRYLSQVRRQNIRLAVPPYYCLIDDDVDTMTSSSSDQTYDRIVVYGQTMKRAIVPRSAKIFDFQTAFRLSEDETEKVSDHYPVEVELKTKQQPAKKGPQKKTVAAKRKNGPSSSASAKRRR